MMREATPQRFTRHKLARINDRVREYVQGRLDRDALDIAKLYQTSRDKLAMHIRGIYDMYLRDEPTFIKARSSGALRRIDDAVDMQVDLLTRQIGEQAIRKTADILNTEPRVVKRLYRQLFPEYEALGVSSATVLGELTTNVIGGATFEDRLLHMQDGLKQSLIGTVRQSLINGDDFLSLRGKIHKAFGVDQLRAPKGSAYGSVKLYKNEARRQWNLLQKQRGKKAKATVVWWAWVDDPDTTPGCLARHGLRIDEDLDGEAPPRHFNCRCEIMLLDPEDADMSEERALATALLKKQGWTRGEALAEESMREAWSPEQHPRDEHGKFIGSNVSPEELGEWAKAAGGRFDGIQSFPSIKAEPLALLTLVQGQKTLTTGVLPLSQVSKSNVKDKLDELKQRMSQESVGWAWGRSMLMPASRITEIWHDEGTAYQTVGWRALPWAAMGEIRSEDWRESLLMTLAMDRPDRVLIRRQRGSQTIEVMTWTGWRDCHPREAVIETAIGFAEDSDVLQPPWDQTDQKFPAIVTSRWPVLAPLTIPRYQDGTLYMVGLLAQHQAEMLTLQKLESGELSWTSDQDFVTAVTRALWRHGHPGDPYLVVSHLTPYNVWGIDLIVGLANGQLLKSPEQFDPALTSPYRRVAAVVLERDGRIWAVLPQRMMSWVLPGGHIDPGEHPADAVVREMQEETGLPVRVLRFIGTLYRPWSSTEVYLCRPAGPESDAETPEEIQAAMAIDFKDLAADERLFLTRHGIQPRWQERK